MEKFPYLQGVNSNIKLMANIITLNDFFGQQEILYDPRLESYRYFKGFKNSDLGRIYDAIPWKKLISFFFSERTMGRPYKFPERTQIGLMILKSYTGLSDKQLMERLQSDIFFQIFCNIHLSPDEKYNSKIISDIRVRLAERLQTNEQIQAFQKILNNHWKDFIDFNDVLAQIMMADATCYESWVRYPTDAKLLFEAVEFIHEKVLLPLSKEVERKLTVNNYYKVKSDYKDFSRKRRKTHKQTKKIIGRLLYLLANQLFKAAEYSGKLTKILSNQRYKKLQTVIEVYKQQSDLHAGKSVKNRIVSLSKPYIRPIVRGKETKRVEFGAKVHLLHIDGIDYIEHLDFNAFNEGKRLIPAISLTKSLLGEVRIVAVDGIYGTNENRKYCTQNNILTSFVRKGRAGKNEQAKSIIRQEASKLRATRMEGTFGVQKNHYNLSKIKARKKETEILWIVFGIHTKNALEIGRRTRKQAETQQDTA